jgi:hypothetical protein
MIGNGSKVKLHSLAFKTREEEKQVESIIDKSYPGQIITIPFKPMCVNVQIFQENLTTTVKQELKKSSITEDGIVIPIFKAKFSSPQKPIVTNITSICYTPAKVIVKPTFPLQLGAAVTVDKAQGRTLDKVVACLSQRSINTSNMNINALFVTLSRVRKRDDLRILLHDDTTRKEQLKYIEKMTHDEEYFDYLSGFGNHTHQSHKHPMTWDQTRALQCMATRLQ